MPTNYQYIPISNLLCINCLSSSGADIENMVNQAALKAAKDREKFVTMEHLDFARDKILMGMY